MSDTNKTSSEIAADILIAMIPQTYATSEGREPDALARKLADAYKTLYAVVKNPAA